jgi:hypothetical protein
MMDKLSWPRASRWPTTALLQPFDGRGVAWLANRMYCAHVFTATQSTMLLIVYHGLEPVQRFPPTCSKPNTACPAAFVQMPKYLL